MSELSGRLAGAGLDSPAERLDTLIIGGGQGGLSAAYSLAKLGLPFTIIDDRERTGDCWRERYDSLRLFSPAKYDALPGMPFPASAYAFPSGHQMADYLESYARQMRIEVRTGVRVDGLWPAGEQGGYVVVAGQHQFVAAQVVVATGAQQLPYVPSFAAQLDQRIRQMHSSEYRGPAQLRDGDVLVVGVGHSGADIALDAARQHRTWLSGTVHGQVRLDIESRLARPVWRLVWFTADHVLTVRTPLGRKMKPGARGHGGPLVRVKLPELAAAGVEHIDARATGVRDGLPELDDGRVLDVSNVIWCTGYEHDFSWVHLPVTDEHGWPIHERGVVSAAPGLYFVGLPMQYAYTSNLVGGAGRDAGHVARHIAARQGRHARAVRSSRV
jgi:putative flavoprotein involved in K+ transport